MPPSPAAAAEASPFPLPWVAEANLLPRITMAATGTEGGEALQAHWSGEEGGRRAESAWRDQVGP